MVEQEKNVPHRHAALEFSRTHPLLARQTKKRGRGRTDVTTGFVA
jgi:hypothetical protein